MTAAQKLITELGLQPHPEGGWYRETFRQPAPDGGRAMATAILFLLDAGERSHWHRVDAAELWLWHAGSPLALSIADADGRRTLMLGAGAASCLASRTCRCGLGAGFVHRHAGVRLCWFRSCTTRLGAARKLTPFTDARHRP
jgi:hypothetical protein